MTGEGLADTTRRLVYLLAALYVLAAAAGIAYGAFDTAGEIAVWVGFLCGGAALMVVGQRLVRGAKARAAAISAGALVGGLPLVWTIIVPVAAAVVVTCAIALARRDPAPA
jgi:hypothetical protein